MSTNGTIAIQNNDGTITGIYSHWNGYIESNGEILLRHYQEESKIRELIEQGFVSVLNRNIGVKVDFNDREVREANNQCLFYYRDRNEKCEILKALNYKTFLKEQEQSFNYLWANNKWYVSAPYEDVEIKMEEVTEKLIESQRVST